MKTPLLLSSLLAALLAGVSVPAAANEAGNRWQAGDWMVRGRAIGVVPDESSTLSVGGKAHVSDEVVPELDFTYFLTNNIAAELILATAKHHAKAKGVPALGDVDAGSVWVLPPTLTLQYHFTQFDKVKPYIGAGVNYTVYYNEKGGALQNVKYKNSFGLALQAGVDVPIDDRWSWNVDVKKLFLDADAKWADGTVRGDIELDPWIVGVGVGYRF